MADAAELVNAVRAAALAATEAAKPVQVCFGRVIRENPLQISVEQKLTLGEAQLVLCRNVTDYKTHITGHNVKDFYYLDKLPDPPETSEPPKRPVEPPHIHAVGRIEIIVHNALKKGEEVVLLRMQGGQKYLVVDRLGKGAAG